jgi:hypothetical protein
MIQLRLIANAIQEWRPADSIRDRVVDVAWRQSMTIGMQCYGLEALDDIWQREQSASCAAVSVLYQ